MQTAANRIKDVRRARTLAVLVTCLAAAGLLVPGLLHLAARAPAAAQTGVAVTPADALLSVAALAAAGLTGWLVLGVVLETAARVPGAVGRRAARLSTAVTPRVVRRTVGLALGVGMGLGAVPVSAAPARAVSAAVQGQAVGSVLVIGDASPTGRAAATNASRRTGTGLPDPGWAPPPDPGWTPDPPAVRPQPDVAAVAATSRRGAGGSPVEVVVHRGDSLWSVAARHLGPAATDREVAAEWPRWYAANRAVIGPDPDLVLPGQVLRAPEESP
jgi:hypothetical protein